MVVKEIKPGIFWTGAIDWDRRLFDALIPLPEGTSYNSYLVRGDEKTALIDTVDPAKEFELVCNLVKLEVDTIDYIVVNHAEQDHSGALPMVLELFPGAKIVTNDKCSDLLVHLLEIPRSRIDVIGDRDTLSLGNRTLEFISMPWVHWPETMVTYAREDKILFSCDLFGSHLATSSLYATDERTTYQGAKRYYAEIMMPFKNSIRRHLEIIEDLDIEVIAPSHGPLYHHPAMITDAYREWVSDDVKNEVVIPYVSMHGSTGKMVDYFIGALMARGITVKPFNMASSDIGNLAMALVDAATVVFGTPTVLFGPHPEMVYAAYLVNMLKPKMRFASVIGSYGWGQKTVVTIHGMLDHIKPEFLEPVYIQGAPGTEALAALDRLADDILKKHQENGIL